jgi:anti-sigma-K factor RskA
MKYSDPTLIDALASEYAMGTMRPLVRARFTRLLRDRADARAAVAQWYERLAVLAQPIPSMTPSPDVWAKIAARTVSARVATSVSGNHRRRWSSWWFGLGGALTGAAACLLGLIANPQWITSTDEIAMRTGEKSPQSYVGVLSDANGRGRLLVSSLRHGKTVTLKVLGADPLVSPSGSPMYLWALPTEGAPFLVATVQSKGVAFAQLSDTSEKLLSKVPKLAVTSGATPDVEHAKDAKNHLLSGACAKLW